MYMYADLNFNIRKIPKRYKDKMKQDQRDYHQYKARTLATVRRRIEKNFGPTPRPDTKPKSASTYGDRGYPDSSTRSDPSDTEKLFNNLNEMQSDAMKRWEHYGEPKEEPHEIMSTNELIDMENEIAEEFNGVLAGDPYYKPHRQSPKGKELNRIYTDLMSAELNQRRYLISSFKMRFRMAHPEYRYTDPEIDKRNFKERFEDYNLDYIDTLASLYADTVIHRFPQSFYERTLEKIKKHFNKS